MSDEYEPMLQFFRPSLIGIHQPFAELAKRIVDTMPRSAERSACLRKLLEAKDCAVRAQIYEPQPPTPPSDTTEGYGIP